MKDNSIERSIPASNIAAADRLVAKDKSPLGHVKLAGELEILSPIFGVWPDSVNPECVFVLVRWIDGSGQFIRYNRYQVSVFNGRA